jgi:hypothetical protein
MEELLTEWGWGMGGRWGGGGKGAGGGLSLEIQEERISLMFDK